MVRPGEHVTILIYSCMRYHVMLAAKMLVNKTMILRLSISDHRNRLSLYHWELRQEDALNFDCGGMHANRWNQCKS